MVAYKEISRGSRQRGRKVGRHAGYCPQHQASIAACLAWIGSEIRASLALLVLQLFLLFVALPLAATGVPIAAPVAWLLLLLAVTLVVMLSRRVGASVFILLGLAAAAASFAFGRQWSPIAASVLNHGGFIVPFSALTWVVAHALYAPGRITFHRLQGAAAVYLSLATIFANAFGLVWGLVPGFCQSPRRSTRRERIRDDALFQPRDIDHDGLRPSLTR